MASNDFPTASDLERGLHAGEDGQDIEKCVRSGRVDRPAVGPLPSPGSGNAGNPAGMTRAGDSPRPYTESTRPSVVRDVLAMFASEFSGVAIAEATRLPIRYVRGILAEHGHSLIATDHAKKRQATADRGRRVYLLRMAGTLWPEVCRLESGSHPGLRQAMRVYCLSVGITPPVEPKKASTRYRPVCGTCGVVFPINLEERKVVARAHQYRHRAEKVEAGKRRQERERKSS